MRIKSTNMSKIIEISAIGKRENTIWKLKI